MLEAIKGKDIDVEIPMKSSNGMEATWSMNGSEMKEDFNIDDIDFGFEFDTDNVPMSERSSGRLLGGFGDPPAVIQFSLAHDGEFGFTAGLDFKMSIADAGKHVYVYYYNEEAGTIDLAYTAVVDKNGYVQFTLSLTTLPSTS